MTPDEWKALSEQDKEVWRQRFRRERRQIYTGHRHHSDFQKGMIFWFAGDVYHVIKACIGISLLFGMGLGLLLLLSGCADTSYWYQRTAFGIDCRPDHLQANGHCAPVKN